MLGAGHQYGGHIVVASQRRGQYPLSHWLTVEAYVAEKIAVDVAHNADGLNRLFTGLDSPTPYKVIFGLSSSKDIQSCLLAIAKVAKELYLVEASNGRGFSKEILKKGLIELGFSEEIRKRNIVYIK